MSLAFRTGLAPSRRGRSLRRIAQCLTVAAAAACLAALLLEPSGGRLAAALASIMALAIASLPGRAAPATGLVVAADGTIRVEEGEESRSAIVGYCSEQLICLLAAGRHHAVWPDGLSGAGWRRLLIACRWPRAPGQEPHATVRTK